MHMYFSLVKTYENTPYATAMQMNVTDSLIMNIREAVSLVNTATLKILRRSRKNAVFAALQKPYPYMEVIM